MAKLNRRIIQVISAISANSYIEGFLKGTIYRGRLKFICFPGLNCYSCPGALTSCPIGSIQAFLSGIKQQLSLYVLGFLMAIGTIGGRFVCGWICPFGLFQDLLYKIPAKKIRMKRFFGYFKYVFLIVFVLFMPAFIRGDIGIGTSYFCKFICPAGTLEAGIPLAITNKAIRSALGLLYYWKLFLLFVLVFLSIIISRPFCRAICPLGAIYSLFNPISFYSMNVDLDKCIACDKCKENCPVDIRIYENADDMECIRCGECVKVCPRQAISLAFNNTNVKIEGSNN